MWVPLFSNLFQRDYLCVLLEDKQKGKSGELIDHGFYPFSAMVYKYFNIYLLLYIVYLEYLQVQVRSGEIWWFWSLLRCRTTQTHHIFSYGWRPSHRYTEPIFWQKIELLVSFPMPPVWGQSASRSRSYSCFTEEWSVCLARGSCRGDKGLSIDDTALVSIHSDSRTWIKHISRPFEAQKPHQVTKIRLDDQKPL